MAADSTHIRPWLAKNEHQPSGHYERPFDEAVEKLRTGDTRDLFGEEDFIARQVQNLIVVVPRPR